MEEVEFAFKVFGCWMLSYLVFYFYTREMNRVIDEVWNRRNKK